MADSFSRYLLHVCSPRELRGPLWFYVMMLFCRLLAEGAAKQKALEVSAAAWPEFKTALKGQGPSVRRLADVKSTGARRGFGEVDTLTGVAAVWGVGVFEVGKGVRLG